MKTDAMGALAAIAALVVISACSSPEEAAQQEAENWQAEEVRQQGLVERAVRSAYEDEGMEVTELDMRRSDDGSEYTGRARVLNPESGDELTVDCTVYADARGAPQLECNRVQGAQ